MRARSSILLALVGLTGCTVPGAERESIEGERLGQTRTYAPEGKVVAPDELPSTEADKRALAKVDAVINGPGGVSGCEAPIPEVMTGFPLTASAAKGATPPSEQFAQLKSPALAPRTQADAPLELRLTGPATRKVGDGLALELEMVNRTDGPLVAMRSLDGSPEHWRSPYYDLYLEEVSTGRQFRWDRQGGRCGNVNAIKADDYVDLAPGASTKEVTQVWGGYLTMATILKPGTYRAWVVYQFCGFQEGGLPLGKDLLRSDVHHGIHVSNAVTIDVK